jgi:deoxycytidylate deaminase
MQTATTETEDETLERKLGARDGILRAYQEHQDLLILALTGRTGSGCTTAADLLATNYQPSLAEHFKPTGPEDSKHKIISSFCKKNWTPFSKITVSALLLTFLLEETWENIAHLNSELSSDRRLDDNALRNLEGALHKVRPKLSDLQEVFTLSNGAFANYPWASKGALKIAITHTLPSSLAEIQNALGEKYSAFLQEIGDNLRRSGSACDRKLDKAKLFMLPQRIVRTIECIREIDKAKITKTRIVVDAIRNPLELVYIRDRYSPLYAIAITADEEDRYSRLVAKGYSNETIGIIDGREYPKKHDPLSSYDALVTQDIQSCLQKADIFISNPGRNGSSKSAKLSATGQLYSQLTRYCTLALHPGLVTPTRDERCMQVAFIAKANSGCISRQVGAAVTDEGYAVKAIGWNDVPKGQVPCSLRNVEDLLAATDETTYSTLERENDTLREHIRIAFVNRETLRTSGLPCSFCFKDAANNSIFKNKEMKGGNQVHTRSLHAEENAFLQLTTGGGAGIRGGKLFTTASPCELCSKKAYQLGIKDIVYIDPYPGISISHVISSGAPTARPVVRLFSGAIGKAYHRVYEPMLPVKDELSARLDWSA